MGFCHSIQERREQINIEHDSLFSSTIAPSVQSDPWPDPIPILATMMTTCEVCKTTQSYLTPHICQIRVKSTNLG